MGIPTAASKAAVRQAYDIDRFRESLLIQGLLPIIPPRPNRTVPEHPAFAGARGRVRRYSPVETWRWILMEQKNQILLLAYFSAWSIPRYASLLSRLSGAKIP